MAYLPSVTGDIPSVFEFDVNNYGAVGDGTTNDRPAIVLALAAAVAAGGVVKFSRGTYRVSTSITLTTPCKFDIGATIKPSSAQVITFTDTIIAEPKPIFDRSASGLFSIYPQKQGNIYAEWWGAKTMADPTLTTIDADTIDCAPAFNAMFTSFYGGSGTFTSFEVKLLGWYAVSSEVRISAYGAGAVAGVGINIIGKNPSMNGTGFKWIGTATNTSSILHLSGCEFASITNVGFKAPRAIDETAILLAAIRLSWLTSTATQRGITIKNIMIGDPLGYFLDTNYAKEFMVGVLEGGPSFLNGNNDFHILENLYVAQCVDGIRIDNNQAVEWQIVNYRANGCNTLIHITDGGQFYGRGWYAASTTFECVIKSSSAGLVTFILDGFSCEHLVASSFIKSDGYIQGSVSGNLMQKSKYQRWAKITVTGNVATCTDSISTAPGPVFFTDSMVGQKLTWRTGADAGVRTAIITSIISATSANVDVDGANTAVANGKATVTNADGVNEFRMIDCSAGIVSIAWNDLKFGVVDNSLGVGQPEYNTSDTRMTYNFGASSSALTRSVVYNNCQGAFSAYLYDDENYSHNAVYDFAWIGCTEQSGYDGYPSTLNYRYTRGTVDAQHFAYLGDMVGSTGLTDTISVGEKLGNGVTTSVKSSSPTVGIGYTTGAGGAVTQATSRSTGVTLNKVSGEITLFSAAGSTTATTMIVTNSTVEINDLPLVVQKSGTDKYEIFVTAITAGTFSITYFTTGGTTTEQPVFKFSILKGASA